MKVTRLIPETSERSHARHADILPLGCIADIRIESRASRDWSVDLDFVHTGDLKDSTFTFSEPWEDYPWTLVSKEGRDMGIWISDDQYVLFDDGTREWTVEDIIIGIRAMMGRERLG